MTDQDLFVTIEQTLEKALDRLDPHYHHQLTLETMASSTLLAKLGNVRAPKALLPRTKLSNSMEGWLERKFCECLISNMTLMSMLMFASIGYTEKQWTRSYFVLEDNLLFRYVHRNKLFIPAEVISVHGAHTTVVAPDQEVEFAFNILTPRIQLTLRSKYKGAMVAWIMRLNPGMYDKVSHDIRMRESKVELAHVRDLFNYCELR